MGGDFDGPGKRRGTRSVVDVDYFQVCFDIPGFDDYAKWWRWEQINFWGFTRLLGVFFAAVDAVPVHRNIGRGEKDWCVVLVPRRI